MVKLKISELNIYPIKSSAQVSLDFSLIDRFGLQDDRRWMIVDQENRALTQRNQPLMAKIKATVSRHESSTSLTLQLDDKTHNIPISEFTKNPHLKKVSVWSDTCDGLMAPEEISHHLSKFLDTNCTLVYMPDDYQRFVDKKYASAGETVSFADGFPLLLTTEESLQQFNEWLGETITMTRFRPNIVLSGAAPFAEDQWKRIRVGEIEFEVAKPCSRCMVPSLDPETLEKNPRVLEILE